MFWSIISTVGTLLAVWIHWRYKNRRLIEMSKKFPGPKQVPFFGNALMFMCQTDEFIAIIKKIITDYGDAVCFWLGPDVNFIVSNPDDLKVLLSSMKTSVKGPQYKYMAHILGGGILSGSGPVWRKHRKIATPNYGKRAIESYNDTFNKEIDYLMEKLRRTPMGVMHDVYSDIVQTTSYAVCQTLMGLSRDQTRKVPYIDDIIGGTHRCYDIVFERMTKWYLQIDPVFWLSSNYRFLKKYEKLMMAFSNAIIKYREEHLISLPETVKNKLMSSEDDSLRNTELSVIDRFILSQELDADELKRETFTIFTSSQEASAKIASGILLMLAFHPESQTKLYAEIKSVVGDEDRHISDEDLKRMLYLDMVFREVVRLFPIGSMLQRTIEEDITISSGTLPAGCSLVAPLYFMQRDPRFWTNPEAFDPERFSPENCKRRQPNCFVPFSLGPMDCLGRYFGTKLIKTICVRVLREFEVSTTESFKDLKMSIAISASPLNGYHIILNRRR